MFFADLAMAVGEPDRTVLAELWSLAWAGAVTNDSWHPLRGGAVLRALPPPATVRAGRVARRARPTSSLPAARGRWSLVESLVPAVPAPAERARALAETLLDRHGVLTRAAVLAEGIPGGFSAVYGELRMMEEAGRCQRGYFVEGLGGAQFAAPTAVERLRDVRDADPDAPAIVLSAIDPANPYGAALPWPAAAAAPGPGGGRVGGAGRRAAGPLRRARRPRPRHAATPSCSRRPWRRWQSSSTRAARAGWPPSASTASRSRAPRPSGCCLPTAS